MNGIPKKIVEPTRLRWFLTAHCFLCGHNLLVAAYP
nr:MAG TPA: hypothetical protein [Caudoviricetes sp.]